LLGACSSSRSNAVGSAATHSDSNRTSLHSSGKSQVAKQTTTSPTAKSSSSSTTLAPSPVTSPPVTSPPVTSPPTTTPTTSPPSGGGSYNGGAGGPGIAVVADGFAGCDLANSTFSVYVHYANGDAHTWTFTQSNTGIGSITDITQDEYGNTLATPLEVVNMNPSNPYHPNGCYTL
jgi:hypothetical protein